MPLEAVYKTDIPICKDMDKAPYKGILRLATATPFNSLYKSLDGIFSFNLYYQKNQSFTSLSNFMKSQIVEGLRFYMNMVHDTSVKDKMNAWGIILYTDKKTYQHIRKYFPFHTHPKLIIAVVMWPYYAEDDGGIEVSILRCMRYQAIELFEDKPVCIRDADTIFHTVLQYYEDHKKFKREICSLIRNWELEFLQSWIPSYTAEEKKNHSLSPPNTRHITEDIVLGTSTGYFTEWHLDIPFPIAFTEAAMKKYKVKKMFSENKSTLLKYTGKGLYAGFVNVGRDKEHISKLWLHCLNYLVKRYYMVSLPSGERLINDYYAESVVGSPIGKDEKLLIFVFLPLAFSHIHFLYIEYPVSNPHIIKVQPSPNYPVEIQRNNLIRPGYIEAALQHVKANKQYVGDQFKTIYNGVRTGYEEYLAKVSEEAFYKEINDRISDIQPSTQKDYFLPKAEPLSDKSVFVLENAAKTDRGTTRKTGSSRSFRARRGPSRTKYRAP